MFQAGQVLNGRYKLLRPLGQGSQAHVWVAEHLALGSQVAVKLIDPDLAKQQDARDRFAREASAAAKLRSAHVVQILDHGIDGEQPYIVMELLEGEDLFDRLERRVQLSVAETSKIVTQVARALMRAHAEGIIHRDLKPENVFLVKNEDEELAKVLDFGVAKVTAPQKAVMTKTGVGTLIGTPHYMSPEQVKGLTEIDHRSDLWSLGVIAYQCVTGHLPFDSEGVGDLLIRITMTEPEKPSSLDPQTPAAFDDWFKKACAKQPEDRFQTAREMADALARAVGAGLPVSQPGRVLVSLGDSPDLDWGSLAGVRIPPPPPRRQPSPVQRAEAVGASDIIEVVEGGSQPPPSSSASRAAETQPPPSPPPASGRAAPAVPAPLSSNPFLSIGAAPVAAGPAPAPPRPPPPAPPPAPPPSSPAPSSSRGLQTTVTGLSSTPFVAVDAPPELDGSRKRRAGWFVAIAVTLGTVAVIVGVIQSRGGFDSLSEPAARPAASTPRVAATTAAAPPTTPAPTVTASAVGSQPAPSASASAAVLDPTFTKKPTKPTATAPVGGPRPAPKGPSGGQGDVIIIVPDPPPD